MENPSKKLSWQKNSAMIKERADYLPVVLSTIENMDSDKTVPVVNITPVRFIGKFTRQGRAGSTQGAWDPEILVAVITTVGVPVEEDLDDIGMKATHVVIHMDCDGEASWVKFI